MQWFYGAIHEPLIRCFVRFDGTVETAALKDAIGQLMVCFPLIGCCFDEKKHRWRKASFGVDDVLQIRESAQVEDAAYGQLLLCSISIERESPLKLFLAKTGEGDALCCIVSHMVCDAGGFKDLLYLLAALYAQSRAGEYGECGIELDRSFNQIRRNIGLLRTLGIVMSKSEPLEQSPDLRLPLEGKSGAPFLVKARLDKSRMQILKDYAHSNGATINDLFLTAYSRVLSRMLEVRSIALPCPVDLRTYRKDGQICGICNLTSTYQCKVEIGPYDTFNNTLGMVSVYMRQQKSGDGCLKGPILLHTLFPVLPYAMMRRFLEKIAPVSMMSYTNAGIIDKERLRFDDLRVRESYFVTAVRKAPYFQISVSSFDETCMLTSAFSGSEKDRVLIERIIEDIIGELAAL